MTRVESKEATRRALIAAARTQFAADGFAGTGLSQVVDAARVTKGALYHHFASKTHLFEAVLAQVQAEVGDRVAHSAEQHANSWSQLVAGCRAFLEASTDEESRRIMLIDGPAVLGWDRWRALDEATSGSHLEDVVEALVDDGTFVPLSPSAATRLLSGAMNEAALWLAASPNRDHSIEDAMSVLGLMLAGLRREQPSTTLEAAPAPKS